MSVAKKKRISKKNKSAWRKTDIQDVEDYLEDQRQEERIGSFAEKKDEDLFIVDTEPQKVVRSVLSEKQKRKLNAKTKPLRSLQALENTSNVPDPIRKRNHVKRIRVQRNLEEEVCNPTNAKHVQANKDRALYYEKLDKRLSKKTKELEMARDIWQDEDFRDKIPGLKDEKGWISRALSLHVTNNIGKKVIKVHDGIRHRTTKAKNFEPPHPGMSYNPSLKDHLELVSEVVDREEKIIKDKKHLKRVTTQMFSKVTPEERDLRHLKEMRAGMDDDEEHENENAPNANNEEDDSAPYTTMNPPVENKKKSKKARRNELQQKQLQKKHNAKKAMKKQIADLNKIKFLKIEVAAAEQELNKLKKRRKKMAIKKKFETKRLGHLRFVEPDIDMNMVEDIAGNLRNVKQESSLLVDRFKSFQRRNMLPASVATGKQKAKKVKRFPRSTHKQPGISFREIRMERIEAAKTKGDIPI